MSSRLGSLFALALFATVLSLPTPAEARRIDEAREKVDAVIAELGIDRSRIKSIFIAPDVLGARSHGAQSYAGWISFNDCKGNLAITMSPTAHVLTMYTTGDCVVPGVD
jgi:hypothetical protein